LTATLFLDVVIVVGFRGMTDHSATTSWGTREAQCSCLRQPEIE